jgi:hypothetical protein
VASALTSLSTPIDLADSITATVPITIVGNAIAGGIAPTQSVPLMGVFGLAYSSPPLTTMPNGDPLLGRYAQADLRYIGTIGPLVVNGERMLYFALVSYGEWSTPLEVTYHIALDTNNDSVIDFRLQNRESTDISTFDFATTDDFVSILEPVGNIRRIQGPLNIFKANEYDTRAFDSNVMILPLRLADLGANVDRIHYQVTSTSRDVMDTSSDNIEVTPILSLPIDTPAALVTNHAVPIFPVTPGEQLTVTFDRAAYVQQHTRGVLLLYLHNQFAMRSQTLPVAYEFFYDQYLPGIRAD